MEQLGEGLQNRQDIFDSARPMAADYPLFGTGPGTFGTVFQLYLISSATYWPEQLHNDWLETRITFGWLGLALLLAALACVGLRWFVPGGIRGGRRFVVLIWLALAGCLIEACYDFPFQIHSILFLFLVFCAVLFSLGRRSGASWR
jgi:O-antigen ligase